MSTTEHPSEPSEDKPTNLSRAESDGKVDEGDRQVSPEKGDSRSISSMRSFERISAMMQFGPGRDPFVDKMTPEHVAAVIAGKDKDGERKHTEELAKIGNQKMYAILSAIFVVILCSLFLFFHQTDHLDAVLGTLAGLAGGFGIGKASSRGEEHHG